MFDADSAFVHLLLTYVAKESKREMTFLLGAQNVYKDRKSPKGYARSSPAWWFVLLICWAQTCRFC